nr:transient receptor potential cation channel protein painless-like [Onthophagus taurus]
MAGNNKVKSGKNIKGREMDVITKKTIDNDFVNLITFINQKKEEEFINYFRSNETKCFQIFKEYRRSTNNCSLLEDGLTIIGWACEKHLIKIIKFLLPIVIHKHKMEMNKQILNIFSKYGFPTMFEELFRNKIYYDSHFLHLILITLLQNCIIYESDNVRNYKACIAVILNQDYLKIATNEVDVYGNTVLHYAVQYGDIDTINNLLKRNAFLDITNKAGVMPVDIISAEDLEKILDACIKKQTPTTQESIYNLNRRNQINQRSIKFDYTSLFSKGTSEANVILRIGKNPKLQHLLKHPVISTVLYLKNYKMRKVFIINLVFHVINVAFLIGYILSGNSPSFRFMFCCLLSVTLIIFILKELTQIILALNIYITDPENYLDIFILTTSGYMLSNVLFYKDEKPNLAYYYALASAIILTLINIMFLIARCLPFTIYVSVLKTVTWNFFKFIIWSSILLIAFAFGMYIIYNIPSENNKNESYNNNNNNVTSTFFDDPILTFLKVVVMLIGELDASSLLEEGNLNRTLSQIFFLFFIFFVTIILSNVINGLAISDIQEIKKKAKILSLLEQITRIEYFERMLCSSTFVSKIFNACLSNAFMSNVCDNCGIELRNVKKEMYLFSYDDEQDFNCRVIDITLHNLVNEITKGCQNCCEGEIKVPLNYIDVEILNNTKEAIQKLRQC